MTQSAFWTWATSGLAVAITCGASLNYICAFCAVAISCWTCFAILGLSPLINPIQWVAFLIAWWFGVAPPVLAAQWLMRGGVVLARNSLENGASALWVVSIGLLLYCVSAEGTRTLALRSKFRFRLYTPEGVSYPGSFLVFVALTGIASSLFVRTLAILGVAGTIEVNYLGGTITSVWWIGVLNVIGGMLDVACYAGIWAIVMGQRMSRMTRLVLLACIAFYAYRAILSGYKGPIITLVLVAGIAMTCNRGRPPILIASTILIIFILVVEPFVSALRDQARKINATDSSARREAVNEGVRAVLNRRERVQHELDVGSVFRGIYPVAGEITRRSTMFYGEWEGATVREGVLSVVPRRFLPDKPDQNIGNFFSRTIGVDLGITDPNDYINNISPFVSFELVGNYGLVAGVLSFALLGLAVSVGSNLLLTPERLSLHPLCPLVLLQLMKVETSVAVILATVRDLTILLIVFGLLIGIHRSVAGSRERNESDR